MGWVWGENGRLMLGVDWFFYWVVVVCVEGWGGCLEGGEVGWGEDLEDEWYVFVFESLLGVCL